MASDSKLKQIIVCCGNGVNMVINTIRSQPAGLYCCCLVIHWSHLLSLNLQPHASVSN